MISQLSSQELSDYIKNKNLDLILEDFKDSESNLGSHLDIASSNFPDSERTKIQNDIAKKLSELDTIPILSGPAGCGKTRIALEWAKLNKAQKIIWICPRVQICQGIFEDLINDYLPDADIEIFTGDLKYKKSWNNPTQQKDFLSGDIVVTTIDQILNTIISHTKSDLLLTFMTAHVVFDEYHEYSNMEIFNLLFAELIQTKKKKTENYDTLLISATTPHPYLNLILGIDTDKKYGSVIEMPSFNQNKYKIEVIPYDGNNIIENPFYKTCVEKTLLSLVIPHIPHN